MILGQFIFCDALDQYPIDKTFWAKGDTLEVVRSVAKEYMDGCYDVYDFEERYWQIDPEMLRKLEIENGKDYSDIIAFLEDQENSTCINDYDIPDEIEQN